MKYLMSSVHHIGLEHEGVEYGATVQRRMPENLYRIISIWDTTRELALPMNEIEREYRRKSGSLGDIFRIGSKRAARRRVKQYVAIWSKRERASAPP